MFFFVLPEIHIGIYRRNDHHSRYGIIVISIVITQLKWVIIDKPKLCECIIELYLYINLTIT